MSKKKRIKSLEGVVNALRERVGVLEGRVNDLEQSHWPTPIFYESWDNYSARLCEIAESREEVRGQHGAIAAADERWT